MLDLAFYILSNDSDVTAVVSDRISPMIRPQEETFPAIVFGLTDSKFENISTMGGTTSGSTRSASDIYSISVACLDDTLGTSFNLHEKVRAAFEGTSLGTKTIGSNEYRIHSIHLTDVLANVLDDGEIYVFEGVFEFKISIL